ncbi:hypothetical protein DFS34DRAFT_415407 [Phlyctochytrium arcticum]|nr:hypothetical protein DFS34DRAFT_415407 [Phlyctochytrium arcticum]
MLPAASSGLRVVVLQDSVEMKKRHPNHPLWTQPIFNSTLYKTFAADLEATMAVAADPLQSTLQDVSPDLINYIDGPDNQRTAEIAHLRGQQEAIRASLLTVMAEQERQAAQSAAIAFNTQTISSNLSAFTNAFAGFFQAIASSPEVQSSMANIIALANPSTFTALASVQQQPILPSSTLLPRTITAAPGTINSVPPVAAPAPPSRATDLMPNTTSSIVGYWEEYNEGAHGNEPLKVIEEREGTKWRLSGADSKIWGRRQTFHQAILKRVEASPGITGLLSELGVMGGSAANRIA